MKSKAKKEKSAGKYDNSQSILKDFIDEDIDLSLEEALRKAILKGKKKKRKREGFLQPFEE